MKQLYETVAWNSCMKRLHETVVWNGCVKRLYEMVEWNGCMKRLQVRQFDEEKLESRVQKLKDSLFVHDPQLAQLVKLDSTGATDVEQDTERQLLSVQFSILSSI